MLAYYLLDSLVKAPVGIGKCAYGDAQLFFEQAFVDQYGLLQFVRVQARHAEVRVTMSSDIAAAFMPCAQFVPRQVVDIITGSRVLAIALPDVG